MDSLRVIGDHRVVWLNVTGSGNETAAHVQECPRMTIMFAAFEGNPVILRLYGEARVIHRGDVSWRELYPLFPDTPGARQIFDVHVDLVQTSCGMSVPFYDYVGERTLLSEWAAKKDEAGIREYWGKKIGSVWMTSLRTPWRRVSSPPLRRRRLPKANRGLAAFLL